MIWDFSFWDFCLPPFMGVHHSQNSQKQGGVVLHEGA